MYIQVHGVDPLFFKICLYITHTCNEFRNEFRGWKLDYERYVTTEEIKKKKRNYLFRGRTILIILATRLSSWSYSIAWNIFFSKIFFPSRRAAGVPTLMNGLLCRQLINAPSSYLGVVWRRQKKKKRKNDLTLCVPAFGHNWTQRPKMRKLIWDIQASSRLWLSYDKTAATNVTL